jgi:hypothetical protein
MRLVVALLPSLPLAIVANDTTFESCGKSSAIVPPFGSPATSLGKRSVSFACPPRGEVAFFQEPVHCRKETVIMQTSRMRYWAHKAAKEESGMAG